MDKREKEKTPLSLKITFIIVVIITGLVITSLLVVGQKQKEANFFSRYTYSKELSINSTVNMDKENEARLWINGFLNQFTGPVVPKDMKLKKISIDSIESLSGDNIRLQFSADLSDVGTDYFSDWNPRLVNGRMHCDWTIRLGVSQKSNKEYIYVVSLSNNTQSDNTNKSSSSSNIIDDSFIKYKIENNELKISYNGGDTYSVVPVDIKNLPLTGSRSEELKDGSYSLSNNFTAFLTGGITLNGNKLPLSLIFSSNMSDSWTNVEIDKIFDVSTYYVNVFSNKKAIVAIGYAKTDAAEYSKIYKTEDGGNTWTNVGSGPNNRRMKGINFIDENTGFFCYEASSSEANNLYVTRDGGKTYSPVTFAPQQLDSDADKLTWDQVYKEATVPILNSDGSLTVYLTQGKDGTYHNGKTVAKYRSTDNGQHWDYVEQTQNY